MLLAGAKISSRVSCLVRTGANEEKELLPPSLRRSRRESDWIGGAFGGSAGFSSLSADNLGVSCDAKKGGNPCASVLAEVGCEALEGSSRGFTPFVFFCAGLGRFFEGRSSSDESSAKLISSDDSSLSADELTDSSSELECACAFADKIDSAATSFQ